MKLTVSILCFNNWQYTQRCLKRLQSATANMNDVEVVLTDNGSTDNTAGFINSYRLPNKVIVRHGLNLGFGEGHNRALEIANGEFFVMLNNDVEIRDRAWVHKILQPFSDPKVALVGLHGTPCTLRDDGTGQVGPLTDYVEASLMAARTETVRKFGLFSPTIKKFWCEDSDLSLRYRQMGYKVAHVRLQYFHPQHATIRTLDPEYKERIRKRNLQTLTDRWGRYFKSRQFSNRILIRIPSIGIGDVLCATPVIAALRRDHPTAEFVIQTPYPEVFENNPFVGSVEKVNGDEGEGFDRVISLAPDFQKIEPIYKLNAQIAATTVTDGRPQIFLTDKEIRAGKTLLKPLRKEFERIIAFAPLMGRKDWRGRNWNPQQAREFVALVRNYLPKTAIVELGRGITKTGLAHLDLVDRTSLRELFGVMNAVDGFIGIDSLCLHVAQAFNKPIWALFGATEPISRIVDFSKVSIVRQKDLPCIGCYHKREGTAPFNTCARGLDACMSGLTAEHVWDAFTSDNTARTIEYLHNLIVGEAA